MASTDPLKVAILYPGQSIEERRLATTENNRHQPTFAALEKLGIHVEPAVYHDEFHQEVEEQLKNVDGVLVWYNPIQDGVDRTILDQILRRVSEKGIFVSAHPDVIMKLGTKEVLYHTRGLPWGSDTYLYRTIDELQVNLMKRLSLGEIRVLKQSRGNGGYGIWKVEALNLEDITDSSLVRIQHATRGSQPDIVSFSSLISKLNGYFNTGTGVVIDQIYQPRLTDGMIRCYFVQDKIHGFGFQAINALYPPPQEGDPSPTPTPREYFAADKPEFQELKRLLENDWIPKVQDLLEISTNLLPVIWDADLLFGPKTHEGADTYILCEINVSSVAPYPESAIPGVANATLLQVQKARSHRLEMPK